MQLMLLSMGAEQLTMLDDMDDVRRRKRLDVL
jgi:hypothetical protein